MKKLLLLTTMLVSGLSFSQTSGNVNVKITLHNVQTITVNASNVALDYYTQSDYLNGVNSYQTNHLSTFSTQPYKVNSKVLQSNVITTNDVYLNNMLQTTLPQTLITSPAGVHMYDVNYGAKGNYEYLTKDKISYYIDVVYTIEPQ